MELLSRFIHIYVYLLRAPPEERPAPDLDGDAEREGWEGLLC